MLCPDFARAFELRKKFIETCRKAGEYIGESKAKDKQEYSQNGFYWIAYQKEQSEISLDRHPPSPPKYPVYDIYTGRSYNTERFGVFYINQYDRLKRLAKVEKRLAKREIIEAGLIDKKGCKFMLTALIF